MEILLILSLASNTLLEVTKVTKVKEVIDVIKVAESKNDRRHQ